jgi:hypothetical protein
MVGTCGTHDIVQGGSDGGYIAKTDTGTFGFTTEHIKPELPVILGELRGATPGQGKDSTKGEKWGVIAGLLTIKIGPILQAHQDEETKWEDLPQRSKYNVRADRVTSGTADGKDRPRKNRTLEGFRALEREGTEWAIIHRPGKSYEPFEQKPTK